MSILSNWASIFARFVQELLLVVGLLSLAIVPHQKLGIRD